MNKQFLFLTTALINFAGCSQKFSSAAKFLSSSSSSQNAIIQPKSESVQDAPMITTNQTGTSGSTSGGSISGGSGSASLSPQECYVNYVSIFKWENANNADAESVYPVLSSQKLATLKIFNSVGASGLKASLGFGDQIQWKIYFIIAPATNGGNPVVTSYMNKKNEGDMSYELTCGFGPKFDANYNIIGNFSFPFYQGVGVGLNGVDGQVGFLRHKDNFIICKITGGSDGVIIHGAGSEQIKLNQAFAIKRGCYQ